MYHKLTGSIGRVSKTELSTRGERANMVHIDLCEASDGNS